MNAYEKVTARIVDDIQKNGKLPWEQPWVTLYSAAVSHTTGKRYSILNSMLCGGVGEFLTYNQAKKEGGHVKKGAHGRPICFYKQTAWKQEDETTGEITVKIIPVLKSYTVFSIDDCEGIDRKHAKEDAVLPASPAEIDSKAEAIIDAYLMREGIQRREGGESAYYRSADDSVTIPERKRFAKQAGYYGTIFHELCHSTGKEGRLGRKLGNKFGSPAYAREELVAEIGSAMILHTLGMETDQTERNNSAYVQSWLKALQDDPKMIVWAASRAEKAAKLVMGIYDQQEHETEEQEGDQTAA